MSRRKTGGKPKRELFGSEREELRKLRAEVRNLKKLVEQLQRELQDHGIVHSVEDGRKPFKRIDPITVSDTMKGFQVAGEIVCPRCKSDNVEPIYLEPRHFAICRNCYWRATFNE